MKIRLTEDWKAAHKWFSTHAMLWASVIQIAYMELPDELKASISPKVIAWITSSILILGIAGRVIKQGETDAAK